MQFGLSTPRDRERDEGAEDDHVTERNTEKCVRIGDIEQVLVEAAHDDRDGEAERHHDCCKANAKPTNRAVHLDLEGADERGLQDVENYPGCEYDAVDPKKDWARDCRMKEGVVDGVAEATNHNRGDEQRH